jgi:hypothetical protein
MAPNDPGLLAAKGGVAGGGCANIRTFRRHSRRWLVSVDRLRCKWPQFEICDLSQGREMSRPCYHFC